MNIHTIIIALLGCLAGVLPAQEVLELDSDPPIGPIKLEKVPQRPASHILDNARIFKEDERQAFSEKLVALRESGIEYYVAAFTFLLDETIEDRASRIAEEWLTSEKGIIMVYVRESGQMTFSSSVNGDSFLPRHELQGIYASATGHASEHGDTHAQRIDLAASRSSSLIIDRLAQVAESSRLWKADNIKLMMMVVALTFITGAAVWFFSKFDDRVVEELDTVYHFPDIVVSQRLGAAFGAGIGKEVRF